MTRRPPRPRRRGWPQPAHYALAAALAAYTLVMALLVSHFAGATGEGP